MATNKEMVAAFYLSYYGRPADTGGLAYWTQQLDLSGGNLGVIVNAFANSAESTANFGALTPAQHIAQLYQDLLGRAPEAVGAAYWLSEVTAGRMTIAQLAINVYAGALGADATTVQVRQQVADQFTAALPANGTGYSGQGAVEAGRLIIQTAKATTSPGDVAALATAGVTLAASATANPTLITALIGANGHLTDLLGTTAGAANPLALVNLINTIVATAAGNSASLTTLLGTGTLTDLVTNLPSGVTLTGLDSAIKTGGFAEGAVVVGGGGVTDLVFLLTTAPDTHIGGGENNLFSGLFSDGGTNTFNAGDTLNGNGGTDTLQIGSSIAATAITLDDTFWTKISNIEKLEILTTTDGVQTFTFGDNFYAAFTSVDMKTNSSAGAINITLGGNVSKAVKLTTTSTDGIQTLNTGIGAGLVTVDAISTAGGLSISGSDVTAVTTQSTGGNQIINVTNAGSSAIMVNASSTGGTQSIATGAGDDIINTTSTTGVVSITGKAGNDTITLKTHTGIDTIVFSGVALADGASVAAQVTANGVDVISGFVSASDKINVTALGGVSAMTDVTTAALADSLILVSGKVISISATGLAAGLTTGGTAVIAAGEWANMTKVAAYLDELMTVTSGAQHNVIVLNDTSGSNNTTYVYVLSNVGSDITIDAADIALVGTITHTAGTPILATALAFA